MALSRFSNRRNDNTYLYTKGGEFSLDGNDYIGEYHIVGLVPKSGPTPSDNSKVLRRYYDNLDHYIYDKAFKFKVLPYHYIDPKPHLYKPIEQAYINGFDARYFVEKINTENSYAVEINKQQYDTIGKIAGIDGGLYVSVTLNWKFTGTQQQIAAHNQSELTRASRVCPTIAYAVRSITEHARITAV